ncbi:long-chain fatty acid--CoA ligase [Candidatus Bathyarchaeota archaeon]|nr:MAG: long-chain fatty acid--CoA ligase [Candidatus Bathyarchaeota archaeon]
MASLNYPRGVPISINYPEIPLYAFLENSARKFPDRDAVVFYGRRIKYEGLWDSSRRLANALRSLGVEKGDRVGLLLPNVPQFIIAYNAILAAGGIVVPVNPLNPVGEIGRELDETDAKVLIVLDRLADRIPEFAGKIIVTEAAAYVPWHLRLLSGLKGRGAEPPEGVLNFEELVKGPPSEDPAEIDPREDLAVILYTSGTTGPPKGVMLTHHNLVANALQSYHWLRGWGYSEKPQRAGWPIILCAVPFFHSYGMTVAMNESVQFGCTLVLVPEPSAEAIMEAIQRHEATHFPTVPRFIREILRHPALERYDLTSLTSCVSGGASTDPALMKRFVEITGARFYQGYGLTEAGPTTHCTPIEGEPRYASAGLAFPDTEARIVDLQIGEVEMPPGEKGELLVRGPQVMKGYWKDQEETARVLRDGWLHTGDIATVDEEGYLYVVGRKRDRIISGGRTVWPSEVEEALESHPSVARAVAIGVPDPLRCDTGLQALVTLEPGVESDDVENELTDYLSARLEYFRVPSEITVVDSLPLTVVGKVDRLAVEADVERRIQEEMERASRRT